ncbi:cytochrome c [Bradyrhizobium sp. 14AA]
MNVWHASWRSILPFIGVSLVLCRFSEPCLAQDRQAFEEACARCHGDRLQGNLANDERAGPPLTGENFVSHWSDAPIGDFYDYIRQNMPKDRPSELNESIYIAATRFILGQNQVAFEPASDWKTLPFKAAR